MVSYQASSHCGWQEYKHTRRVWESVGNVHTLEASHRGTGRELGYLCTNPISRRVRVLPLLGGANSPAHLACWVYRQSRFWGLEKASGRRGRYGRWKMGQHTVKRQGAQGCIRAPTLSSIITYLSISETELDQGSELRKVSLSSQSFFPCRECHKFPLKYICSPLGKASNLYKTWIMKGIWFPNSL